jgi:peptidoglycan/LPS O-acetylase OafA/YrhL
VEVQFYAVVALAIGAATLLARLLPARRAVLFEALLTVAALAHLVLFVLWSLGRAPATFGFLPYFIFGAALYYALRGSRVALAWTVCMVPLMVYQFVTYQIPTLAEYQVDRTQPPLITGFYTGLDVVMLLAMLAATVLLARTSLPISRRLDRFVGDLSYPLYLNHVVAGVLAASVYPQAPAALFLLACLTGIALSAAMHMLVEPPLRTVRNLIRGRAI